MAKLFKRLLFVMAFSAISTASSAQTANMQKAPINVVICGPDKYPPAALQAREEGTAIIAVLLRPDGTREKNLLQSSGFQDLDSESLYAAQTAALKAPINTRNDSYLVGVIWSLTGTLPAAPN